MITTKSASILTWDAAEGEWVESRWTYYSPCSVLFRRLSRAHWIEKRIHVIKYTKLRILWENWVTRPMTSKDRKRLKVAERMPFRKFTEHFLSMFETDAAIERVSEIMRETFIREESSKQNHNG